MPIPKSLSDKLFGGHVVPFVGAGVSMSVLNRISRQPAFPSWRHLLSGAAYRLEQEMKPAEAGLIRSLLNVPRPDFLYAASQARKELGAIWYDYLRETLDISFNSIDPQSLELARQVWRLGSDLVVTTNYDEVLRWACPPQDDLQVWDIEAPVEQASWLQQRLSYNLALARPYIERSANHLIARRLSAFIRRD